VLVQLLAGADPEEEAAFHHHLGGRGGLGDDGGVDADRRTRDAGAELQPLRRLRDAADHAPDERALALRVDPGVVVVGDQREREAGLLRRARIAHEVVRAVLLRGERVAELHRHIRSIPPPRPPKTLVLLDRRIQGATAPRPTKSEPET
jgi:hypothetical protein